MLRNRKTWTCRTEVLTTLTIVKEYVASLEDFSNALPKTSSHPKSVRYSSVIEMKVHVTEFVKSFHQKKLEIVNFSLDREKWKVAGEDKMKSIVPTADIKALVEMKEHEERESVSRSGSITSNESYEGNGNGDQNGKADKGGGDGGLLTVEVFFVILDAMADYCHLLNRTGAAEVLLSLVDLLRVANARIAHLVLGAGAVELKVCKSITVVNLVLVYRGICLLSDSLSQIRDVFEKNLQTTKSQHIVSLN